MDSRVTKLAELLVDYSVAVKKGDNVLVVSDILAKPLVLAVYKQLLLRGAHEIRVNFIPEELSEIYYKYASKEQLKSFPKVAMYEVKNTDCVISIISGSNTRYLSGINPKVIAERSRVIKPIKQWRVEKTRWVAVMYPVDAWAQEASMSLSEYEDFVYGSTIGINWKALSTKQETIRKLLDKTKTVRLVKGEETNLTFAIAGRKAENCDGKYNMPDGEIFTSVIENSADGFIVYSYPAIFLGREFEGIKLEFKKGKVVKATCLNNSVDLNNILDTDSRSRYLGEFGIGNNYQIKRFTKNILFDEKIGGTVHLALGSGYKATLSKNHSAIHWDMICDLRDGGQMYLDGKLVQENGRWLV